MPHLQSTVFNGIAIALCSSMVKKKSRKKVSILVIDSDREFCRSVGLFLEEYFTVFARPSLKEIRNTIHLNHIQLLLLDADNLSEQGVKQIKWIKEKFPYLKIILMYTYLPENGRLKNALLRLTDDVIPKPFDVQRLFVKIQNLLPRQDSRVTRMPMTKLETKRI